MRKICFVKFVDDHNNCSYCDINLDNIALTIKEWEEVDDETYALLRKAERFIREKHGIHLLERFGSGDIEVITSVKAFIEEAKKLEDIIAERKRVKAEAALKRKIAQEAKEKEKKRQMLELLKKELGEE